MVSTGIRIMTKSPLLLSAGPSVHNLMETLEFIPGNTVRGMLAQRFLSIGGKADDPVFRRLFLSSEVRYGFAYINGAFTLPLSARSCKYEGGFTQDGGHGVTDILIPGIEDKQCRTCDRPLDYYEGFYDPATEQNKKYANAS